MNDVDWARSRLLLAERARRYQTEGHAWLPQDPITERRHCRRCPAFLPGRPDQDQLALLAGDIARPLGWWAEKGTVYRHGPNPAWARVKASLTKRGLI